jgi:hypothetical protein
MEHTDEILECANKIVTFVKEQKDKELKEAHKEAFAKIAIMLSERLYNDYAIKSLIEDIITACEDAHIAFEYSHGNTIAKQIYGYSKFAKDERVCVFILFDGVGFRVMIDRADPIKNDILKLLPF